jgi:hypothetical protein
LARPAYPIICDGLRHRTAPLKRYIISLPPFVSYIKGNLPRKAKPHEPRVRRAPRCSVPRNSPGSPRGGRTTLPAPWLISLPDTPRLMALVQSHSNHSRRQAGRLRRVERRHWRFARSVMPILETGHLPVSGQQGSLVRLIALGSVAIG